MTRFGIPAFLATAVLLTACADQGWQSGATSSSGAPMSRATTAGAGTGGATTMPATTLAVADQAFIVQAAYSGLAEVSLGEHARQNAASQAVRDLGAMLAGAHDRANRELMGIAHTHAAMVPTTPDPGRQATAQALAALQGPTFDQQYLMQQLAEHEVAIALFQAQARGGQDPALKAFAAKWLPDIRNHTETIRTLAQRVASTR